MPQQLDEKNNNVLYNIYDKLIFGLHRFIYSIKENIVLFLACIIFTTGILYIINNGQKGHYKSSFTVAYDDLVRKIYGDRLEKINALIGNNNYVKVARLLSVSLPTSQSLVKVKGTNILGQDLSEDMNTDRIPFIVTITVRDSSKISDLQNGLVSFLEEGNTYMVEKKQIKIKEVQKELDFINDEMRKMDSLKKKFNESSFNNADNKNSNSSPSATIYQFSYELYKKAQELERKKSMPATIQVLDDAIAPKSVQKGLMVIIILGLISGTILYILMRYLVIPVFRGHR